MLAKLFLVGLHLCVVLQAFLSSLINTLEFLNPFRECAYARLVGSSFTLALSGSLSSVAVADVNIHGAVAD